jgi:sigma-B regulation protein RsbU (phosphoserine phosphatase)
MAIGDVSGKGIGAALLMASLQASLKARALHPHSDLAELIGDVNRLVHESSPIHFFASLFYAEYQPSMGILRYVNAGHNPPIVLRWNEGQCAVFTLETEGTPVGLMQDTEYTSGSFQLETGDVLAAYTDGITETENPGEDMWGQERLKNLLCGSRGKTPQQIIRQILDELSVFAKTKPQRDDMTLLVAHVRNDR